jgi:hypothetical protein
MANIQIGKYKRPGIFIEEFDQTILTSGPAVEGVTNLVIGSSKKGPINRPIRLTSVTDLESIFGPLDRQLERKGSFFHRTISKMLEVAPVFAMNLLITDDNLDTLEYKTISTSAGTFNDIKRNGPYRKFFDTTGFWTRDTESFISLTNPNLPEDERGLLNITNLSDRPISVFIFKSQVSGFNRTLLEWYGSSDRLPTFVNEQDFASDYMVDVLIVGGDWSNYQDLSVDPRWGSYFNLSGLRKEQVRNFANDRNVANLAFYEGLSLIPFFRDSNGRNVFIENVINRDSDRTGLFCAFNTDLAEEDFYNGKLDLIGNTIAGQDVNEIDFLSYKGSIIEQVEFTSTPLDLPGNVSALFGGSFSYSGNPTHSFGDSFGNPISLTGSVVNTERTAYFGEGYIYGLQLGSTSSTGSAMSVGFTASSGAFSVIGGTYIPLSDKSFTVTANSYPSGTTQSVVAFTMNTNGEIEARVSSTGSNPPVLESDIVLGYVTVDISGGLTFSNFNYNEVTIGASGYVDLLHGNSPGDDYYIDYLDNGVIEVTFWNTINPTVIQYEKWRRFSAFNHFLSILDSPQRLRSTINLGNGKKFSLKNSAITNIVTDRDTNKSFRLDLSPLTDIVGLGNILDGYFVIYTTDNEFIIGKDGIQTIEHDADIDGLGVVAEFSTFYRSFFDGIINTGDFFIDDNEDKIFLNMSIDGNGVLTVDFSKIVKVNDLDTIVSAQPDVSNFKIFVESRLSNLKQTLELESDPGYFEYENKILVNTDRYTEVRIGDFLEAKVDESSLLPGQAPRRLTRILSKKLYANNPALTEIICDASINKTGTGNNRQTIRYVSIDNYISEYKCLNLKGFKLRQDSLPDGTEARQNQILNIVAKGTPLFKSLVNKDAIDFRYVVDSFGLGLTEKSKQQLVDICGSRLDTFGFINMPSIKTFKNSQSPSFLDKTGVVDVEYIAKGGNPESSPAFLYSFGDGPGSTCVGYFLPYLTVNDNERPLDIPPSSYVATTYMRKHISNISSVTPWTIAAGVNNGRITNITDVEIDFTLEDIEFLNQAQMNPIVFKKNRGFVIETQNTAQTLVSSALSLINVREVLIELERELSAMLLDFQWKINTPDVRSEIKLRADTICETYVNRNGLFNYFNKMDDENNTIELIDNQIGVLDTYVEPIRGMGIIVNNITILRTGAISAGGFING